MASLGQSELMDKMLHITKAIPFYIERYLGHLTCETFISKLCIIHIARQSNQSKRHNEQFQTF